jgi:hypothetical protein
MAQKPPDTWVSQVITLKGKRDNVYSKIDGSLVGYMKDGKFIQTVNQLPKLDPKKKPVQDKQFAANIAKISALNSIPQLEQDAAYYKDQAENPNITPEERATAKGQYDALNFQVETKRQEAGVAEETVTEEQGKKDATSAKDRLPKIQSEFAKLKKQYDVLLDPLDNDGRGPSIKSKLDTLAQEYSQLYPKATGTPVISKALAFSRLAENKAATFEPPASGVTTPPAGPADATKRGTEAVAKTGDIPATPGKSKVPNAPKTPKTPLPTAAEKEAEALGAAADLDFSIPQTIFKNVPSLQRLLQKYSDPKLGMTQKQFLKELRDDVWYKNNSEEIKNRYIQLYNYNDQKKAGQDVSNTDYAKQISTLERKIADKARLIGSGIASDPDALRKAAENFYITNVGIDDAMATDLIAAAIRPIGSTIAGQATSGYSGQALQNYQTLQSAAKANGFSIADIIPGGSNEQQVLAGIATGAIDINRVAQDARKLAAQGQPQYVRDLLGQGYNLDQVYAPYRQTMASILEVQDPNQIDLNDPTLRMAITDKGDMNLYDFKKALKKDNRWQYTENARQEVSSAAFSVLRDFGFQG